MLGGKNSIFSEMTEPILFKFEPQMQINKKGGLVFLILTLRSEVKIKGQIFDFAINPEQLNRFCSNLHHIITI